ncbi:AraC family transcriptional regulator [Vibrio ostreicida]|uniref:AraC family transcriptional regulator n=1 Tax=Vibrio ostreicida TaxID=526588 RepID=UPI0009708418|nr:AraC family transcriptional regulator [Vibrio ostreicida]
MHYAISHHHHDFQYLTITPRKRSLKHQLFRVEKGLALVRFGKSEYAVEPNQAVWIPIDALCSVTYFPQTSVQKIEVSCRVRLTLPKQGGYVRLNELCHALLNRLKMTDHDIQAQQRLLAVVQTELTTLKPQLKESRLTQLINLWSPHCDSSMPADLQLALTFREAHKRLQSGVKKKQVIADLFDNNERLYTQIEKTVLGR